ncbi:MAG: aminotransferase class I/II-fold pyridoxal phosphate-dependent enzyme, partial [Clostridiales bacterium]|nr:aminotransferase class I/II-fold pyridoxal phosphate-dependent enzyme [Clostridiales bacterium]
MSEFFSQRLADLKPYVAGEQPKDGQYIKLNTNESPYFPSRFAVGKADGTLLDGLRLYSDPECSDLARAIAEHYGIKPSNVLPTNGSDEALAFCFAAFCDSGAAFPDVTYGFYKVFARLFGAEYTEIPLDENFAVRADDYIGLDKTVVLANPNAQTGVYLPLCEIERIIRGNPNNVVIIDEAYIDFGGESAVSLIDKYKNLVVVQTFSKSRSLAGARVGVALACETLID